MVYLSNCKSQKKLYQEQLFYWNSIETEAALFMCLFIRFLYLGYNYLLLKKKKKTIFQHIIESDVKFLLSLTGIL